MPAQLKFYLLLFSLVISSYWNLSAQEVDYKSNYEKGLKAFKNKDFTQSVKFFEASLSGELKSAEAYNNLGLAYYNSVDLGRAILNFERALRIRPSYSAARKNLKAAEQYIETKIKRNSGFWLFSGFSSLSMMMSSFAWSLIFFLLLFSSAAAFLLWYLKLNDKITFMGLRLGIIFIILALFPFGLANNAAKEQSDHNSAIVTAVRAGVRTAPGLDGEDIIVLSSGVKAKILEEMGDWYKIRLDNSVVGWIPAKTLEKI